MRQRSPAPSTITIRAWNPATRRFDLDVDARLAHPDQRRRRGGPICCVCGGPTYPVLDGEAWCGACGLYQ